VEHISIQKLSAPKGEFLESPQSSKPITASGYELRLDFIAMVREQPFSGFDDEKPLPPPTRVRAVVLVPDNRKHGTGNTSVEVVSFLPY
jgi:hypothetical protein